MFIEYMGEGEKEDRKKWEAKRVNFLKLLKIGHGNDLKLYGTLIIHPWKNFLFNKYNSSRL